MTGDYKTLLIDVLKWIIGGGGATVLVYGLMEMVPFLAGLEAKYKRLVSYLLGGTAGAAAARLLVWFGVVDAPATSQEWVLLLFAGAFLAVSGSQLLHGYKKM